MAESLSYVLGRDGFVWWLGVVEDRNDPVGLGRLRVRVFGYHTDDKTKLPTSALPWALCVQPATSAASGGIGFSPTGPIEGTWVIGFWRDPDFMQEPMILGTLPGVIPNEAVPKEKNPYNYSLEQVLNAEKNVKKSTHTGIVNQAEYATPKETTDSIVVVKVNGVVQTATNLAPTSTTNALKDETPETLQDAGTPRHEGISANDTEIGGGRLYTEKDFSQSRFARTLAAKVNQLAPEVRDRFAQGLQKYLTDNVPNGYDCSIAEVYRPLTRSAELYRRYKQENGPRAAAPGFSWHNYACAVDFVVYVNGKHDDGRNGVNNYTGVARSAFSPFGITNEIANDSGHFYPSAFGKTPPQRLRDDKITVADYAKETGIA